MDESKETSTRPLALVLKGGGVKGLALAGALEELEEHFTFEVFVGTSAGAIAAVLLAAGYSGKELRGILQTKDFQQFLDSSFLSQTWGLLVHGGLHSGTPVRTWVRSLLEERIERQSGIEMGDLPKRAVLYASNERDGTIVFDSYGDNAEQPADFAVRCSMSIPYFFRPERHGGDEIFDGGLLNNFPLDTFLKENPDVDFLGLYLSQGPPRSSHRPRALRILSLLLGRDERVIVDEHRNNIIVIDPSPIRTTDFSLEDPEKDFLLKAGRAAALEFLARRSPPLADEVSALEASQEAELARSRVKDARRKGRQRTARRYSSLAMALLVAVLASAGLPIPQYSGISLNDTNIDAQVQSIPSADLNVDELSESELRQYIGLLFLVGFVSPPDNKTPPIAEELVNDLGVGGLLLFQRNVPLGNSDSDRRHRLINLLDQLQSIRKHQLPLIIGVDQEGGSTQALDSEIVTEIPAAMALGGLRRPIITRQIASLIGTELRLLGINMNLAPVADVNTNSDNDLIRDRSFGGHWQLTQAMSSAWVDGSREARILSVAKHFPGHGSTQEGIETPGVPHSDFSTGDFVDSLRPFRTAISRGVDAVMTSHFNPVTISNRTVTFDSKMIDLLRQTEGRRIGGRMVSGLGFDGVVMTDDLDMPAVTIRDNLTHYEALRENIELAFLAGHDLLLIGNVYPNGTPSETLRNKSDYNKGILLSDLARLLMDFEKFIFDGGTESNRSERISRFREALRRVVALKGKISSRTKPGKRWALLEQVRPEHRKVAADVFRASFSVIPSNEGFPSFDVPPDKDVLIVFGTRWRPAGLTGLKQSGNYERQVQKELHDWHLARELQSRLGNRARVRLELEAQYPKPDDFERRAEEIGSIVETTRPALTLFIIDNTRQAEQLATILKRLSNIRGYDLHRIVVIVMAHPNLLALYARSPKAEGLLGRISYVFAYSGARRRAAELLAANLAQLEPGNSPGEAGPPPMVIERLNPSPDWTFQADTRPK